MEIDELIYNHNEVNCVFLGRDKAREVKYCLKIGTVRLKNSKVKQQVLIKANFI